MYCLYVYKLRSPSFLSSGVLIITPTYTYSMQDLILQGMQQKYTNLVPDVIKHLARHIKLYFTTSKIFASHHESI